MTDSQYGLGIPGSADSGVRRPGPPTGDSKTGLIVAGGLVLVVVLLIGVAIGFVAGGDSGDGEPAAIPASTTAPVTSATTASTTSALLEPAPGIYSMSGITNACDLVDPTPLHQWSSTPDKAPFHAEYPPSTRGAGELTCQFTYKSLSSNNTHYYQVAIDVDVEFTAAGADPAYDEWKPADTATGKPGRDSGDVTGIGTQGYWASWVTDAEYYGAMTYLVAVQDSNASVRVSIPIMRQLGEPQVTPDQLDAIARAQVQRILDGLKTN
ncbi:hypothetical protein [Nocardia australiensis]|uniref:hypothetical protein n=1 Tax=Nocardia australiensis TaxID=2887191 RepID=UPI001D145B3F|nr:hypothetical protein [Nocardia australiensis]